jgi:hypothetical protein
MSIWIIYGLVIVFLLAFPLLVLALVQSPGASAQKQPGSSSTALGKVSYGAVATLLVLFVVLTFAVHRNKA